MSYDCYCDYEQPEFYTQAHHRARRRYACFECRGVIEPGERYETVSGKWEGHFSTFRTCERCHDIRQWVQNNVPCFCSAHGNLDDDAFQAVYGAASRAPAETIGLRFGLRRRFEERRRFNISRRAA